MAASAGDAPAPTVLNDVLEVQLAADLLAALLEPRDLGALRLSCRSARALLDPCISELSLDPAALARTVVLDRLRHAQKHHDGSFEH